jgi:hypothetical protein
VLGVRLLRRLVAVWVGLWASAVVAGALAKSTLVSEDDPTAEHFALVTVFEGTDFRPTTRNLTASRSLTMFGGTRLDLRRSAASSEIRLELTTVMGGTDVTVPDTWVVTVEGNALMGGHDVRVADPATLPADATRLVISARTVMGGLRVHARPILAAASA